ncbi:1-acyl-sn-glycerol-3-phosphate acyltransferase epsilon [Galemys pyrenaicus]|uniref:1-acyl-sn-glycerol-3-phosphate acyltransferase epsilon n=1 Tax=Galemys pyrenaicus TaxID=202257 RepID=A0A8J5ZZP5_GALPY|nr:1-acyl-sn-glycerol-3-phosphate acyltransferase epsilon [Galemys pyrenaicus]
MCVSAVDWIIADILAARQGALGHVRYVLKDGLKWLPLYGCYFSQHGGIYVKRSAKFSEDEMRGKLQSYVDSGTPVRPLRRLSTTGGRPSWASAAHPPGRPGLREGVSWCEWVSTCRILARWLQALAGTPERAVRPLRL